MPPLHGAVSVRTRASSGGRGRGDETDRRDQRLRQSAACDQAEDQREHERDATERGDVASMLRGDHEGVAKECVSEPVEGHVRVQARPGRSPLPASSVAKSPSEPPVTKTVEPLTPKAVAPSQPSAGSLYRLAQSSSPVEVL
jgi:hypothetical protein